MTRHLYIHIPFCHQICKFCDFKRIKTEENDIRISTYVKKIIHEIKKSSAINQYKTIYLGGGTPNFLNDNLLDNLLGTLKKYLSKKNYEFTIECNPDLVTNKQAVIFKKHGINRVSLGAQTTNNEILRAMNRTHTIADVNKAIAILRKNKIFNINCDFIYDLPNITKNDILDAFNFIKNNDIPHVSFYSLEIKENAILKHEKYQINHLDQEDKMVYLYELLNQSHYDRYEVSNWSKTKHFQSKHNLAYWQTKPWKAIGYGAAGFENYINYQIKGSINEYHKVSDKPLSQEEYYFQILMMGLRLKSGINLKIKRNFLAYKYFKDKLMNCTIHNHYLKCTNIDLLDDLLINLI